MATIDTTRAVLRVRDADGRESTPEFTLGVNPATVDADFLSAIDALATTTGGDGTAGGMLMGGLSAVELTIRIVPATPVVPVSVGDIRDVWELTYPSGARRSVGGRNTQGILTSTESKGELADKTNSDVVAFYDALHNSAPAGLGVVDPVDGSSPTLGTLGVRAITTRRQRR